MFALLRAPPADGDVSEWDGLRMRRVCAEVLGGTMVGARSMVFEVAMRGECSCVTGCPLFNGSDDRGALSCL